MNTHEYLFDDSPADALAKCIGTSYLREQPLHVVKATNGMVLPCKPSAEPVWGLGGCISSDGAFIDESADDIRDTRIFGGRYEYDEAGIAEMDESVIYMGHVTGHWGNFLIDQIARLWYVLEKPIQCQIAYCGIGFKPNTFGPSTHNGFDFLSLLGISPDQLIDIRVPTRFREVVVPELAFIPGRYYTDEYRTIYQMAVENSLDEYASVYSKVYFTRRQLRRRKEVGEKRIERLFSSNGFVVLSPERLSVKDQICCVHNCRILASLEGTLAHNIVFAGEGINQIILRKQSEILSRQHLLNQMMDAVTVYIDVYREPLRGFPTTCDDGPFLIQYNDNLKCFAHDSGWVVARRCQLTEDLVDFSVYIYECFIGRYLHIAYDWLAQIPLLRRIYRYVKGCVC